MLRVNREFFLQTDVTNVTSLLNDIRQMKIFTRTEIKTTVRLSNLRHQRKEFVERYTRDELCFNRAGIQTRVLPSNFRQQQSKFVEQQT